MYLNDENYLCDRALNNFSTCYVNEDDFAIHTKLFLGNYLKASDYAHSPNPYIVTGGSIEKLEKVKMIIKRSSHIRKKLPPCFYAHLARLFFERKSPFPKDRKTKVLPEKGERYSFISAFLIVSQVCIGVNENQEKNVDPLKKFPCLFPSNVFCNVHKSSVCSLWSVVTSGSSCLRLLLP